MIGRRRVIGAAVGLLVAAAALGVGGCDGGGGSDAPSPGPVPPVTTAPSDTAPATTAAATEPVATQPATSLMNINGHLTVFPPARLRLESDGQNVDALLYSDDPREALKRNYTGNSFYLRMALDITDPEKLADANWNYTAPSAGDREADSPYGIFLGGRKIALQPFMAGARIKVEGEETTVLLLGNFQVLDDTPGRGPAQVLPVSAELAVQIDPQQ